MSAMIAGRNGQKKAGFVRTRLSGGDTPLVAENFLLAEQAASDMNATKAWRVWIYNFSCR
jgi:hypothetical protein